MRYRAALHPILDEFGNFLFAFPSLHLSFSCVSFFFRVICVYSGLSDPLLAQHFHGFTTVAFPADQLAKQPLPVDTVIIVENRTSVQQLLQRPLPATAIIFGCGYGVALLKNATWLHKIQLYYWGDLDTHGLAILSQVRSYFPQVQPLLMNVETWAAHQHLVVPDKPFRGKLPEHLTDEEQNLFRCLQDSGQRLEQERLLQNVLESKLPW